MITNQPMTVSITCSGNLNCIDHCCVWDWSDFVVKLHYGTLLDRRLDPSLTQRRLVITHNHSNREEKCDVTSPSLLTEMAICIVERWKKVWPTALFLSAIMYREVVHVIFIFCFRFFFRICRTMFCWDPKIILLQRDVTSLCLRKKGRQNRCNLMIYIPN